MSTLCLRRLLLERSSYSTTLWGEIAGQLRASSSFGWVREDSKALLITDNRDDFSTGSFDLARGPYATYFATLMSCMDLQAVMDPTDDHTKLSKTMSDLKISLNRASDVPAEEDTCLDALLRRGRQRLAERGLEDAFKNMSIDNSSEDKKDAVDTEVLGNTIAWWRSEYKCRMCGNCLLTEHGKTIRSGSSLGKRSDRLSIETALETFRLRKEELQQEFTQGRQSSAASTLRQPSRTETKAWLDRRCELQRSIHGLEHLMLLHDRKPDAERLSQNVRTGLTQLQTHYRTLPHDKSTTDQTSMTAGEVMEAFIRENAFALSVKNQPTPNIQLYIDCMIGPRSLTNYRLCRRDCEWTTRY